MLKSIAQHHLRHNFQAVTTAFKNGTFQPEVAIIVRVSCVQRECKGMSIKHLGTRIWLAGLLIVAAAVVWWFVFFSGELDRASGVVVGQSPYLSDFIACLSISEGPCAVIAGLARVGGRVVYEPLLLWTGIAALWMGATLRILAEWRARPARAARRVRNVA